MDITVTGEWTSTSDYKHVFAKTSDPRVLAVIEREEEYGGGHIDGDCYAPAFYWDRQHGGFTTAGSTFMDSESEYIAERFREARDRFYDSRQAWATAERYLRIFHGTTMAQVSSSIDRYAQVVIFNTPTYREHVGMTDEQINSFEVCSVTGPGQNLIKEDIAAATEAEARAIHLAAHTDEGRYITAATRATLLDGDIESWTAALDGEVYGIGWATLPEHVIDTDEEPSFEDYDVSIEVWGYLGEDYAKGSAAAFEAGTPELPEMLDLTVAQ